MMIYILFQSLKVSLKLELSLSYEFQNKKIPHINKRKLLSCLTRNRNKIHIYKEDLV